jgi:hypothetical protein
MKKQIWLVAGVAGMLLGSPAAQAEVNIRIGERGGRPPSFVFDNRTNFINVPNLGFSVSVGSPQDIVRCDGRYYVNHNGRWYVSNNFRGAWILVREGRLPYQIRGHRWEEIRSSRDAEYRRYEGRNNHDNNFRGRDFRDRNNNQDQQNHNQNQQNHNQNQQNQNNPDDRRPNDGGRRN